MTVAPFESPLADSFGHVGTFRASPDEAGGWQVLARLDDEVVTSEHCRK